MNTKLLVVADLGHLKAFRWEEDELFSKPRLQLIEEVETSAASRLQEEVTDQAGRYRKGSVPAGPSHLSDGEENNLELERRRKALKRLAETISNLVKNDRFESCYFAAGRDINDAVLDSLDPQTRAKIEKNVPSNLTNLNGDEIIAHFSE